MIRPATSDDAPQIVRIYNHYILHSTATFEVTPIDHTEMARRITQITHTDPFIVQTDIHGNLLGYAYTHPWKPRKAYEHTHEVAIYVSPDNLHQGIGRNLLTTLIHTCRKTQCCRVLIACITAENTPSRQLHLQLGFRQVSDFKAVGEKFGRLLDITDYQLTLTPTHNP